MFDVLADKDFLLGRLLSRLIAVSVSGYRGYRQCSSQHQCDDFHDALPVGIEKLQISAAPNHSAQNAVLVDFFV